MKIGGKIEKPISIRLGANHNIIMKDEDSKKEIPLTPGAIISGEHYGFILIVDHNGKQREVVYSTQCRIEAIEMRDGVLRIFEEGKKLPWNFTKHGKLEHSIFNEFTDEFKSKFDGFIENEEPFTGEPTLLNPIHIKIAKTPQESVILKDEIVKEDYPLHPGAVLIGNPHYGFILTIDNGQEQKEVVYPTQNRIYAAGVEGSIYEDLKVFEDGKYHPCLFENNGKLKKEASYNQYSRRDKAFVAEHYGLSEKEAEKFLVMQKKA